MAAVVDIVGTSFPFPKERSTQNLANFHIQDGGNVALHFVA